MSEQSEAPAETGDAPIKAGPKGVVLIGALIGSLVIGGAAGVFAVGPIVAKKSGYVVVPVAHDSAAAQGDEASGGGEHAPAGEHSAGKEGEGGGSSNMHLIDNLVLNPAGTGGSRFLMLSTAIEFAESSQVEEMKTRDAEVRDIVLRVMGSRTIEQLSEMSNREIIKRELADSLGLLFKKKKAIRRIYFPQFVIQ